jgi:hypothetical protein
MRSRATALLLLLVPLAGCPQNDGLTGPAAIEEVSTALFMPVTRADWVEAQLLLSDGDFECNHLVGYVDETTDSALVEDLTTGRHLLATLRREPSLEWPGLYVGETAETLALPDAGGNRLSTGLVFLDGEEILSEQGGYVWLDAYTEDDSASGTLDLGVVEGPWTTEACAAIDRS